MDRLRWYFYQKTKNYRVAWGGIKQGFKTGGRLGAWTAAFVALSEGMGKVTHELAAQSGVVEGRARTRAVEGAIAGGSIASLAGSFCRSLHLFSD